MEQSVSVIIPAYNAEKTIVRALASVRVQTAFEAIKEIIVVDDGSTDDTYEIVKQYDDQHPEMPIVILRQENKGVSSARNLGMDSATGNWIALLDSDDEWLPERLERQFKIITEHGNIDFLGGNSTDHVLHVLWKKIDTLYRPSVKELCIKMFPQTSTVLFKRAIFEEIGGYEESRRYAEDAQFFFKICENYQYYYTPEHVSIYDGNKVGFGVSGLSGKLKEMQQGTVQNYRELYERGSIDLCFYIWIRAFNFVKYIRRIVLCKLRKQ